MLEILVFILLEAYFYKSVYLDLESKQTLDNVPGRWYSYQKGWDTHPARRGRAEMNKNKNERTIEYMEQNSTLIGQRTRTFIDRETGEIIEVNQNTKLVYGQKNFWKCYMRDFISVLKELNDKQYKVFIYIMEHTRPSDNRFIATYQDIMEDIGCCKQTVASTLNKLKNKDFMRKIQAGVWIVNPDILIKGNDRKREMLLSEYHEVKTVKDDEEKNIKNKNNRDARL